MAGCEALDASVGPYQIVGYVLSTRATKGPPISMRVGEPTIKALADVAYATNLTSGPLIRFFNSFGLQHPVVKVLESKRNFALGAWSELNGSSKLSEAIAQLLSPAYWPDDGERRKRAAHLSKALKGDGIELSEIEGRYIVQSPSKAAANKIANPIGRRPSYSLRKGLNPNAAGFPLDRIKTLFAALVSELQGDGYFHEYFGFYCVDAEDVPGKIKSPEAHILLTLRKDNLWPIGRCIGNYTEDDLFDMIEYLFNAVSKPLTGTMHSYGGCGMHWETFDKRAGDEIFRTRINEILGLYEKRFELSEDGEILHRAEEGFEPIIDAKVPTNDEKVRSRVEAAVLQYRRHGSTADDRRRAVRDLADVLEYLRPQVKTFMKDDEPDLFNIANNFGVRHHNQKQKTGYDQALWLSWMFYLYLSTIHLVARKIGQANAK